MNKTIQGIIHQFQIIIISHIHFFTNPNYNSLGGATERQRIKNEIETAPEMFERYNNQKSIKLKKSMMMTQKILKMIIYLIRLIQITKKIMISKMNHNQMIKIVKMMMMKIKNKNKMNKIKYKMKNKKNKHHHYNQNQYQHQHQKIQLKNE